MHNTTVAKLLAKENIEVQYGNYNTAWFDIQNRTLGLPLWKDMGKDVHDLLVGHEVGHALFTPYEGWHDTPEKLEGCPRSYINVIEDARIEKMIRRAYPGLVGPMARGYKVLSNEEFFGDINNPDWDQVKLIDKINLKAKLNNLIEVPFNNEEATLFNRTMNTETFEEVLKVVKDVLAYTKENQPELMQNPEPETVPNIDLPEDNDMDIPEGHDDQEAPAKEENENTAQGDNDSDQKDSSEKTEEEGDDTSNGQEESEDSSDSEKEESDSKVKASKTPEESKDADVSLTDILFRDSEKRLLDTDQHGNQTTVARDRGKNTISSVVIPYSSLREERKAVFEASDSFAKEAHETILDGYPEYIRSVKKSVNVAVKEFEMKKAAFQWQRASTAKTGSINVDRLWSYKTNDDIFKRVTNLADAKNHGMVMLIDYSGSMSSTMPQVLDQLIHLVSFCKAVNIPFDVYAFTTAWREDNPDYKMKDGEVDFDNMKMPQLISSSLSKSHYEEALKHLYMRKLATQSNNDRWDSENPRYYDFAITGKSEEYGSTPLNAALITAHHLVKRFVGKHNVEKMNLVVLSDGDSNRLQVVRDYNVDHADTTDSYGSINVVVDGKTITTQGRRSGVTKALLENLKKRYGVTTLGFFISQDTRDWKSKIAEIDGLHWIDNDSKFYKEMQKQYNKNKVAIVEKALGYDKFFMIKSGKNLSAEGESIANTETDHMTTAQIRNTFKKISKNNRNNKVLMKQLGGVVA